MGTMWVLKYKLIATVSPNLVVKLVTEGCYINKLSQYTNIIGLCYFFVYSKKFKLPLHLIWKCAIGNYVGSKV